MNQMGIPAKLKINYITVVFCVRIKKIEIVYCLSVWMNLK